jgi:hypothetical protein
MPRVTSHCGETVYSQQKAMATGRLAEITEAAPLAAGATPNSTHGRKTAPTAASLLIQSQDTTEKWYRARRTTKAYANYVKSGKAFLESWASSHQSDPDGTEPPGGALQDRSTFAYAFDTIDEKTPIALRLLLAYKCDYEGKGFATAEGMRSAFKSYFEMCVFFFPCLSVTLT